MPNNRRPRQLRGRNGQRLRAAILERDRGICAICGHDGADTLGHKLPVQTHPQLALDPRNMQAEHGRRRTLDRDGYECEGNYARADRIDRQRPSREW